jgi:hypothetical protein
MEEVIVCTKYFKQDVNMEILGQMMYIFRRVFIQKVWSTNKRKETKRAYKLLVTGCCYNSFVQKDT